MNHLPIPSPSVPTPAASTRPGLLLSWPTRLFLPCLAATSLAVLADGVSQGWGIWVFGSVALMLALSQWSLKAAFYTVAFLLPLGQVYSIGMSRSLHTAAPVLELPLLAFFVAWFLTAARQRTALRSISRDELPWLPFLVFALGAALMTCAVGLSQDEFLPKVSLLRILFKQGPLAPFYPFRVLFTFVESFMLYWFVRTRLERRDLETLCRVLLGAFFVVLVAGFVMYGLFDNAPLFRGVRRAVALFLGPNELGTYLLMTLPVVAWTASQSRHRKLQALSAVGGVSGVLLLYLTHSQGAWLAGGLVLAGTGLLALKSVTARRRVALGALALLLVGAGGLAWMMVAWPASRLNELSDGRYFLFLSGSNMVRTSPWVGVGLGRFNAYLGSFYPEGIAWRTQHEHAHNMYLQVIAELGVIGFALLFWPLGKLLVRGGRGQGQRTSLAAALLVSTAGALLHGLTDYTLLMVPICLLFWLQVGMLDLELRSAREAAAQGMRL